MCNRMSDHPDDQAGTASDSPLDQLPAHDRVSIRAVLVREGEDPGPALAAAGIVDPVAVPVVVGEQPDLSGGILGDGVTGNLTGVLETEPGEAFDVSPGTQPGSARAAREALPWSGQDTSMLPAAYGMQPLAPLRKIGDTGQRPAAEVAFHGDRAAADPPKPGRFSQADPVSADGGSDLPAARGADPHGVSGPTGLAPNFGDVASPGRVQLSGEGDGLRDGGSRNVAPANSLPPPSPSPDPFNLSQQEIERRYYNQTFMGMQVTQNQHNAMQQGVAGFATAGAAAGLIIESMTEGAELGSLGGPVGAVVGVAIGAAVGATLGLIAGDFVGIQEDKAQGIPPLSPSDRH
jgi:hypothetical protein